MLDTLMDSLRAEKTRQALAERWEAIHTAASNQYENWRDEGYDWSLDDAFDAVIEDEVRPLRPPSVVSILRDRLMPHAGTPNTITLGELSSEFLALLSRDVPWKWPDFAGAFDAFLSRIRHLICHRETSPFPIARVPGFQHSKLDQIKLLIQAIPPVWTGNAVQIELCGTWPQEAPEVGPAAVNDSSALVWLIHAKASGELSPLACDTVGADLRRLLPSLIRSTHAIVPESAHPILECDGLPRAEDLPESLPLVREWLDRYFRIPASKDTIGRRIQNAIAFLCESDTQANHAVGLALAVTAIEALVGQNGPETALRVSQRVATLLEPAPENRQKAVKFVAKLYNDRSRVLHGAIIDAPERRRAEGRLLASGVLLALTAYLGLWERGGLGIRTPDDLLAHLDDSLFASGSIAVPEYPQVWILWR